MLINVQNQLNDIKDDTSDIKVKLAVLETTIQELKSLAELVRQHGQDITTIEIRLQRLEEEIARLKDLVAENTKEVGIFRRLREWAGSNWRLFLGVGAGAGAMAAILKAWPMLQPFLTGL